jgi:TonB family protein
MAVAWEQMSTGLWSVFAVYVALPIGSAYGQAGKPPQPQTDPNVACIERLEIPRYPALATQARIEGTITVSVLLAQQGSVQQVDTEVESSFGQAKSLFGSPVWKAISEAKFLPECSGKTIRLVFHFHLMGTSAGNATQSVSFGYPNTFWIVAEAPLFQPVGLVNSDEPIRTGRISGRVTDGTLVPISNAKVTLHSASLGETTTAIQTDQNGKFTFPVLPPSTYDLRVESPGFRRLVRSVAVTDRDLEIGPVVMELSPIGDYRPIPAPKPLTVCEALRDLTNLNGRKVAVRGLFRFTHRHGGWIVDQTANGNPCRRMPRKARIWWPGIWLGSVKNPNIDNGPVSLVEERPTYDDLIKASDDLNRGDEHNLVVTLIGELRTKKNLVIVRAPYDRGDTMGNGYGVGGAYPAMLVVKAFLDVQIFEKK